MTTSNNEHIISPKQTLIKRFPKVAYSVQNSSSLDALKLDLLVYGAPKTGKTHAIGQFVEMGLKPLVIACDPGGMITLKNIGVDFIEINKTSELFEFIRDCNSGAFPFFGRGYNMVCLDGASNLSYLTLKETGESSKNRMLDYAQAQAPFLKLIDGLRRFPCHFYANAWEGELKTNGNVYYGAMAEGNKLSIKFNGLFNTVLRLFHYTDNQQIKTAVQTSPDGNHICGGRGLDLNQYEHTIGDCVNKIINSQTL